MVAAPDAAYGHPPPRDILAEPEAEDVNSLPVRQVPPVCDFASVSLVRHRIENWLVWKAGREPPPARRGDEPEFGVTNRSEENKRPVLHRGTNGIGRKVDRPEGSTFAQLCRFDVGMLDAQRFSSGCEQEGALVVEFDAHAVGVRIDDRPKLPGAREAYGPDEDHTRVVGRQGVPHGLDRALAGASGGERILYPRSRRASGGGVGRGGAGAAAGAGGVAASPVPRRRKR